MAVDAECRQSLLRMRGEHSGQIYRARTLGAVESPHRLGPMRVHVHGLAAVAPAGGHGDGGAHALALEFLLTSGSLGHAPDGAVGNDALHGRTITVT